MSIPDAQADQDRRSPERPNRRLLDSLVCPLTKMPLEYDEARQELISRAALLAYPIRSGIPHMLPSEARHLDDPAPATRR
jgi:uncharacterized protein YbaR (Trm112 family)